MDHHTREMRIAYWEPIIRECRNSGMTVKSWCQNNGVGEKQFYYWQRIIRKAAFQDLTAASPEPSGRFVALPALPAPAAAKADLIVHAGRFTMEIQNSASEILLNMVLQVIAHAE